MQAQEHVNAARIDPAIDALAPELALMALIQITGDRTLLDRYWDAIDGRQTELVETFVDIHPREARPTVDPAVAQDIRDRLRTAVKSGRPAILAHIDRPLFKRMSRLVLGTNLPEMSVDVAFQHSGLTTDTRVRRASRVPPQDFKVLVVGAGVRRQNIRHNSRRRLAECGPRLGVDVKRRACGVASADARWSVA